MPVFASIPPCPLNRPSCPRTPGTRRAFEPAVSVAPATTPAPTSPHRIAVLLLDPVLPLDAGIPLQVFGRDYAPRVRGDHRVAGRPAGARDRRPDHHSGPRSHRARGRRHRDGAGLLVRRRATRPGGARRPARGGRARRPHGLDLQRGVRARPGRRPRRPAGHHALGAVRETRRELPADRASIRTCCTSTRAASSRRPAWRRASTCACTSCAATTARRPRTGWRGPSSRRPGGRASRASSSSTPTRRAARTRCPRPVRGCCRCCGNR